MDCGCTCATGAAVNRTRHAPHQDLVSRRSIGAEASGVESQYRIGTHADSSSFSIAVRTRSPRRAVTENRTSSRRGVDSIALEQNAESAPHRELAGGA